MSTVKMGAPSKYDPSRNEEVFNYCLLGAKNAELAQVLGVNHQTIDNWMAMDDDFFAIVKAGRDDADAKVAKSLYRRAVGYTHKETKTFCYQGSVITEDIDVHVPPDVRAQQLWLLNRRRAKWAGEQKQEVTGAEGGPVAFEVNIKVVE